MAVVAGMAELIVEGHISEVKSKTYILSVDQFLKGKSKAYIKVEMFKEWVCDQRMKAVEKKDKVILFLIKRGSKYRVINGSTGEKFVYKGLVSWPFLEEPVSLEDFKRAIVNFTSAYEFVRKRYYFYKSHKNKFRQLRPFAEIVRMGEEDELTLLLLKETEYYDVV